MVRRHRYHLRRVIVSGIAALVALAIAAADWIAGAAGSGR